MEPSLKQLLGGHINKRRKKTIYKQEPTEPGQSQKTRRKYKVSRSLDKFKEAEKNQYSMMQKRSWQDNKHIKIQKIISKPDNIYKQYSTAFKT